jgi:ribosomal protein S27AE
MSPKWARVCRSEAHGLRRGAWYPVVGDADNSLVILDVNKSNRPASRASLEIRDNKPEHWSVVRRDPDQEAAQRASSAKLGPVYAVCPNCRERVVLAGREETYRCPECGAEYPVDWENPC